MTRHIFLAGFIALTMFSCGHQDKNDPTNVIPTSVVPPAQDLPVTQNENIGLVVKIPNTDTSQVSQYIRRIYQDKAGDLWLATTSDGVCRYNKKSLVYFNMQNGLVGNCVKSILQDKKGNFWFATENGLSRYDGRSFTSYTTKDGLPGNSTWSVLEDKNGTIWVGTDDGVCRYDDKAVEGKSFMPFELPLSNAKNVATNIPKAIRCMYEDRAGNIWFGTEGAGVCRYDGKQFKTFTKKDGLCSSSVVCMIEDRKGRFWFGSRKNDGDGGVTCYENRKFTRYTNNEGISGHKGVWFIHEAVNGDLLFAAQGMDRFNGETFTHLNEKNGLTNIGVQSIFEDEKSRIWIGTGGGLFKYDGSSVVNIRKNGPWE